MGKFMVWLFLMGWTQTWRGGSDGELKDTPSEEQNDRYSGRLKCVMLPTKQLPSLGFNQEIKPQSRGLRWRAVGSDLRKL